MEADEALGANATISSVLYANINHPEWKTEFPAWSERCKQILKKWRALPNDKKAPYLTQARDNRAAVRMKKTQQVTKVERKRQTDTYRQGVYKMFRRYRISILALNLSLMCILKRKEKLNICGC